MKIDFLVVGKTAQSGFTEGITEYCNRIKHGKELSSMQFAEYIEKKMHTTPRRLVFVVGGPYGFAQSVYTTAHEKISLSKMTFSHQMIRLIFTEQLYRAFTILNNEPYHHE